MTEKFVCVFGGSKHGTNPKFTEDSKTLGLYLAEKNLNVVFGGGSVGLMSVVAGTVLEAGKKVIGIIPKLLAPAEISGKTIGEMILVESMHDRKLKMHELSQYFIAVPGGFGTYEELMETITWAQLGIHRKPIGLLNTCGFYDHFLAQLKTGIDLGFTSAEFGNAVLVVESDPKKLVDRLLTHIPPESGLKKTGINLTEKNT